MKEDTDKDTCALCGSVDNDLKTDHLRECYKSKQGGLDSSMYMPRLTHEELGKLQWGFNSICNNRKKCLHRQLTPTK